MADYSESQETKATGAGEVEAVYPTRALEAGCHGL